VSDPQHPQGASSQSPSSQAPLSLGSILDVLDRSRDGVTLRTQSILRGDAASPPILIPIAVGAPTGLLVAPAPGPAPTPVPTSAPAPAPRQRSEAEATPSATPDAAPGERTTGPVRPQSRLRASARPVASMVSAVVLVLVAWLLVLEPLLGSRPVLVTDDAMVPALRPGDIAFAETPSAPVVPGTIVAVRLDGRRTVTRAIDRAPVPAGATPEERSAAALIVRTDAAPIEQRDTIEAEAFIGVVGAAVPRVGLPLVWLRAPLTHPVGALAVVGLLAVTAVGLGDLRRERRAQRVAAPASPEPQADLT